MTEHDSSAARVIRLAILAASASVMAACGSIGGAGPHAPGTVNPTAVVFVATPPQTLAVKATVDVSAAAIYANPLTAENTAVSWSLSCASANACGNIALDTENGEMRYTAPAQIPAGAVVTITATSVVDTAVSASATISIVGPIPIAVSFAAPPPASLQVGATFGLVASIANDVSANPEVTWSVRCASSDCGSVTPATVPNLTATSFAAPSAIPSGGAVTVTATSNTDPSKSVSASIVITSAAATLADGTYVYQMQGSAGIAGVVTTGVFVASRGQITAGEQDTNSFGTDINGALIAEPVFQNVTGGSYGNTADGNLQISLQFGPQNLETIYASMGSPNHGSISGTSAIATTGTLDRQSSVAPLNGGYAIVLAGADGYGNASSIGGILNVDGPGTLSGAGSILDVAAASIALDASSVSAPDSLGRVQILLQPAGTSLLPLTLAGYLIDATHLQLTEIDAYGPPSTFGGVLSGSALGQGSATGQYSLASLAGTAYVFGAQGVDGHGMLQIAGALHANANGSMSGTLNWRDLAATSTQLPLTVTAGYTVDATGRVTITQLTDGSLFQSSLHLYLAADGEALVVSADSDDSYAGQAFAQQTSSGLRGSYGIGVSTYYHDPVADGPTYLPAIGTLAFSPGGGGLSIAGFADRADGLADFALSGTVVTGGPDVLTGTLSGLNPLSRSTAGQFALYPINASQAFLIETDPTQLAMGYLWNAP